MAHYLGEVSGSRGSATRLGTKNSGMVTKAMSWSGMVRVDVVHDDATGEDRFTVEQRQHPGNGAGIREEIASGIIGQPTKKENGKAELIEALKDAAAELIRLHENQADIEEEDLTDIARPDENVIVKIQDAILKAEG